MSRFHLPILLAIAPLSILLIQSAGAGEIPSTNTGVQLKEFSRRATTVKDWFAQIKQTENYTAVEVTKVQINRTETGLEILLETQDGKPLQIDNEQFITEGNTLIANIPNAVLKLAEGNEFTAENPTADISRISINQIGSNSLQIAVVGKNQIPTNVQTDFNQGGETEQSNDALTPRLGLLYRPIPELALFGNYSQSFKPNTSATASGGILAPEEGEGFEVGIKTELLDRRLLATLTYFDITKSNVATTDPDNPLFSIAVGEQKSRGIELDIAGEVLPGWKIIGSYAYIDAEVTNDTDDAIVGNQLFGVPRNKASLWTTYEIGQGDLKGLGFGVGFEYSDNRFGNLANSYRVGNYLIGNAALF